MPSIRAWLQTTLGWRSDEDVERAAYLRCADFCQAVAFHGHVRHRTARYLLAEEFRNWAKGKTGET